MYKVEQIKYDQISKNKQSTAHSVCEYVSIFKSLFQYIITVHPIRSRCPNL